MRVIPQFALLVAASLLLDTNAGAQSDAAEAEVYRNQRYRLHAIERLPYAIETINKAQDPETLWEALEDLLKFSYTPEENETASAGCCVEITTRLDISLDCGTLVVHPI